MMKGPRPGDNIAVWFSTGAASAVAWYETLKQYPQCNVLAINNPVAEEDYDNERFGYEVCEWLKAPCIKWTCSEFPSASAVDVWDKRKGMSFPAGAPCTVMLKKRARQEFEALYDVHWHVLGFTADEAKRYERFIMTERSNVLPVLIDAGYSKQDCVDFLLAQGIELPRVYAMGYPNANCIGCVKATSPTYWNLVRETFPEVFEERAEQSRRLGAKLVRVKNERIYLDELDPKAQGRPLKTMQIECGIFCEEGQDDERS